MIPPPFKQAFPSRDNTELTKEHDRLKAINAELVEALENMTDGFEGALECRGIHTTRGDRRDIKAARAVLDKARE